MLTIDEAATELGVSVSTIKRMLSTGDLCFVPIGGGQKRQHVRIQQSEITKYIARKSCRSTNEHISRIGSVKSQLKPPKDAANDFVFLLEQRAEAKPKSLSAN